MGALQRGQREAGETTDSPSGIREMHTFKKLPITMPNRKKKNGIMRLDLTVTQARNALNVRLGVGCRMVNGRGWLEQRDGGNGALRREDEDKSLQHGIGT